MPIGLVVSEQEADGEFLWQPHAAVRSPPFTSLAQHPIDVRPAGSQPHNDFRWSDAIGLEPDDLGSLLPHGRCPPIAAVSR